MTVLELFYRSPDWDAALAIALARPDRLDRAARPARDLAWLRGAVLEPGRGGLDPAPVAGTWTAEDGTEAAAVLHRLQVRGVLHAAGFHLHEHAARRRAA